MADLSQLMKQAQLMQEKMQKAQAEQASRIVIGEAGGGLVKITMNGKYEVQRVEIDASLYNDERELLEDLVAAACNSAADKVAEAGKQSVAAMTAGLHLPPGFKLPF
ncbi:MAG: YbaB/EbfC family nucleoid-associated protein [Pseudomonadales bacterium]|jgi:DNA-binding YbaB/EbfC family protein|nr:YbaB/EbfC family nucleoid-associated protein [Pseudomonadales bacterium]